MTSDESFEAAVQPQHGLGNLIVDLVAHFGFTETALVAFFRATLSQLSLHKTIWLKTLTLYKEIRTSRSLIRAVGNTFQFPIGNPRVDIKPFIVKKVRLDYESNEDLWDNADVVESGCGSSASDDVMSDVFSDAAIYSQSERMHQMEAEIAYLKKCIHSITNQRNCNVIPEAIDDKRVVAVCEKMSTPSAAPPPPPPAPPLPDNFFKMPSICVTVPKDTSLKSGPPSGDSCSTMSTVSTSQPKVHYADLLKELPQVKLRPVNKSPGGTPLMQKKKPLNELESILMDSILRFKQDEHEDDEESDADDSHNYWNDS